MHVGWSHAMLHDQPFLHKRAGYARRQYTRSPAPRPMKALEFHPKQTKFTSHIHSALEILRRDLLDLHLFPVITTITVHVSQDVYYASISVIMPQTEISGVVVDLPSTRMLRNLLYLRAKLRLARDSREKLPVPLRCKSWQRCPRV